MSLRESLTDTIRDKGIKHVSIAPAKPATTMATASVPGMKTIVPQMSSGGTGLAMGKKSMGGGMGAKNGVGFPKKPSGMSHGSSGAIKGPTKLGVNNPGKGMK
jgi:hypothetical protein